MLSNGYGREHDGGEWSKVDRGIAFT